MVGWGENMIIYFKKQEYKGEEVEKRGKYGNSYNNCICEQNIINK